MIHSLILKLQFLKLNYKTMLERLKSYSIILMTGLVLILPARTFALSSSANSLLNRNTDNTNLPVNIPRKDLLVSELDNVNIANNTNADSTNTSESITDTESDDRSINKSIKKPLGTKSTISEPSINKKTATESPSDTAETEQLSEEAAAEETIDPIRPRFQRTPGERLPITIERYQDFLSERSNRAEKTSVLSSASKERLTQTIAAERTWLADKITELQQAESIEARKNIQSEIQTYVQERRKERRTLVEKNIELPKTASLEKAKHIANSFEDIVKKFDRVGIDTSTIQPTIDEYNAEIQEAQIIQDRLTTNPSIEDIKSLRENIATIRTLGNTVRNHLQTILIQESN